MKILICNERFLFRFGLDRVLILLARSLKERGHTVSVMANRYDTHVLKSFAEKIIDSPTDAEYIHLNEHTANWLEHTWDRHFPGDSGPDLAIVGGWPYYASIPLLRKRCGKVVFLDCGAVPLTGYEGGALAIQEKLRSLRRQYLQEASFIIGISDFIVNSQSKADSHGKVPVKSILLFADHMDMDVWPAEDLQLENQGRALDLLHSLKGEGRKIVLSLGRWEEGCYKNVEAAYEIVPGIREVHENLALLILADHKHRIRPDFKNFIFPIGFPDDRELQDVMKQVDLGLTFSRWEGFNLPLAEMQWLDRPALVFDLAAHPEVVMHPWFLCRDSAEMIEKSIEILAGRGIDPQTRKRSQEKFCNHFTLSRFVNEFIETIDQIPAEPWAQDHETANQEPYPKVNVIIDVTNSTRDPANSGVIRVTRRLCRALQEYIDPLFVVWDQQQGAYVLPVKQEYDQLGQFNGPRLTDDKHLSPDGQRIKLEDGSSFFADRTTWLLLAETVQGENGEHIERFARTHGIQLASIFYDAIPVLRPEFCNDEVRQNHGQYMSWLSRCDVVVPISDFSGQCLKEFWKGNEVQQTSVRANLLPGEFGGSSRNRYVDTPLAGKVQMLCVSTLEPRKNHTNLIRACLLMEQRHPELDWSLTLVGNRYAGAFDIADYVESVARENPRVTWLGIVDDDTLHRCYQEASFTIYPSMIEGFGMPIVESLWHGRPCICYEEGVMAEIAADGGCVTTDVMDEEILSDTIYRLCTDKEWLRSLSREAVARKIKTWDDYTRELLEILASESTEVDTGIGNDRHVSGEHRPIETCHWEDILYAECLQDNWQMNHSERLALTALLARHQPRCSIEVGTYQGGSLSLIAQYSAMVFSIDIDPTIPAKFSQFSNVSFLTGPSSVVLPLLLKELDASGIPVDFILIDGDHSAEGIRQDINAVLSYVPKQPLFIMMHDGFNSECRRGMSEAEWEKSPYVHFVDVDFVPGRVVEGNDNPFQGEMWGGLGLAFLSPRPREGRVKVQYSAKSMHHMICQQMNPDAKG